MFRHYFKITLRNLMRQKGLTLINILGLTIGMACFALFLLYAVNEFSYDRFHKNEASIFRLYRWTEAMDKDEAHGDTYMPMPLGPAMKDEVAGVADYVRLDEAWSESFIRTEKGVSGMQVSYADPQFLSVFSFPMKYGNPSQALNDLHSVVLTDEASRKLYGDVNPVGRIIGIKIDEAFQPLTVTGVCENIPSNSSIRFEIMGNYRFLETTSSGKRSFNNWHRSAYQTYVLLRDDSKLFADKKRLQEFYTKYHPDDEAELRKSGQWKGAGPPITYGLQPLRDMHTSQQIVGGEIPQVNPRNIWTLIIIAGGVLLIACINFTTLAIGRSARRAREVGIRKVVGSDKKSLVFQFLGEALLLSLLSSLIGLLLANILLPSFNELAGRSLHFTFAQFPEMIWLLGALVVVVGLVAGSYPALVLSAFKPVEVLKSKLRVGGSNLLTKSLVTVQFVLSVGLIISTIIILQQLHFMKSKNPGFNKENVVVINASDTDTKRIYPLLRQGLLQHPEIKTVASAELSLGEGTGWSRSSFEYKGAHKNVYEYFVDPDYIPALNIQLLAGRNFDRRIISDTVNSVIVNESMVKDFGWTIQNAVGQELKGYSENFTPKVIGVVKNFHFRPFSEEVLPQMFQQFADYRPYKFFVRIQPGDPSQALTDMEKEWKAVVPDLPFKYNFLDENIDKFYKSEDRWARIVGWAGGISIFLACLGLLGLAALAVVNRTKEIGIRKVLGASVQNLVNLLSKDFVKLVIVALLIASPLAWYFMNHWLETFAYRIHINWWIFVVSGLMAVAVAVLTISIHALRAAWTNPVISLRTE